MKCPIQIVITNHSMRLSLSSSCGWDFLSYTKEISFLQFVFQKKQIHQSVRTKTVKTIDVNHSATIHFNFPWTSLTKMMMVRRDEFVKAEPASGIMPQQLDDFATKLPRPRHLFRRLLSLRQRQPTVGQVVVHRHRRCGGRGGGGSRRDGWISAEGIRVRRRRAHFVFRRMVHDDGA